MLWPARTHTIGGPTVTRLPLSEAALRLGLTYHQVRERLLRGELPGGRDEFGRFYVALELPTSSDGASNPATAPAASADPVT